MSTISVSVSVYQYQHKASNHEQPVRNGCILPIILLHNTYCVVEVTLREQLNIGHAGRSDTAKGRLSDKLEPVMISDMWSGMVIYHSHLEFSLIAPL